jgi:hypothetical protein
MKKAKNAPCLSHGYSLGFCIPDPSGLWLEASNIRQCPHIPAFSVGMIVGKNIL